MVRIERVSSTSSLVGKGDVSGLMDQRCGEGTESVTEPRDGEQVVWLVEEMRGINCWLAWIIAVINFSF